MVAPGENRLFQPREVLTGLPEFHLQKVVPCQFMDEIFIDIRWLQRPMSDNRAISELKLYRISYDNSLLHFGQSALEVLKLSAEFPDTQPLVPLTVQSNEGGQRRAVRMSSGAKRAASGSG